MPEKEPQLTSITIMLMMGTAIFFDLLQFLADLLNLIVTVGNVLAYLATAFIGASALGTFWIWFKTKGIDIGFAKPKRVIAMTLPTVLAWIPALNILSGLPDWTLAVFLIIASTKAKEKLGPVAGLASGPKTKVFSSNPSPAPTKEKVYSRDRFPDELSKNSGSPRVFPKQNRAFPVAPTPTRKAA